MHVMWRLYYVVSSTIAVLPDYIFIVFIFAYMTYRFVDCVCGCLFLALHVCNFCLLFSAAQAYMLQFAT